MSQTSVRVNSTLRILTNNHWRSFLYRHELPEKVLKSQFPHLSGRSDIDIEGDDNNQECVEDGFLLYRGRYYHTSDFIRFNAFGGSSPTKDDPFFGWMGYENDSVFSGTVIDLSPNGESYRIGRFYS